jgi:hypothetical protein
LHLFHSAVFDQFLEVPVKRLTGKAAFLLENLAIEPEVLTNHLPPC